MLWSLKALCEVSLVAEVWGGSESVNENYIFWVFITLVEVL